MYRFIVVYIRSIIPTDTSIPLLGYRALSGWGYTDFHAADQAMRTMIRRSSWKLDLRYCGESVDCSSSSTFFRPSICSKVKRTMPLSLPLCSK
jgi:hypothetical protein